jgi:cell division protein FtsB
LAVSAVVALGLLYSILLGNHGLRQYLALRSTLAVRSGEAYDRIVRNQQLARRLVGLRSDDRVLDKVARSTLGVVSRDEIVYVFSPPTSRRGR